MSFKTRIRLNIAMAVILCIIGLLGIKQSVLASQAAKVEEDDKKTILIDPGHGGYDGGADGKSGVKEKDINLSISLKLRDKLKAEGFKVVMTREEDKALLDNVRKYKTKKAEDLANRCKIKSESNPDLFISIHQNIFPQGQYYGAQVWYSNNKESRALGHLVQENLRKDLDINNKRVEKPAKDNIRILSCGDNMPSVLVECGFLSNASEEQKLRDDKYQLQIVDSLAKSIKEFLKED